MPILPAVKSSKKKSFSAPDPNPEAEKLRVAGRKIASSLQRSLELLEATGMYTKTGRLKAQFR